MSANADVGLWGGLLCLMGRHVRSRGQARATPEGWVSRCARCAMPMARAHGGGKWQPVKTPPRVKVRIANETPAEILAKAIAKSARESQRKEAKTARNAAKEAAALAADTASEAANEDLPIEHKRNLLGRKRKRFKRKPEQGRRRFLLFGRRTPAPVEQDDAIEPSLAMADIPAASKPKRALFRRKRERATAED